MNLKNPVGEKIKMWGQFFTVIGVMDDVLMASGDNPIGPLVMTMDPSWSSTIRQYQKHLNQPRQQK